MAEGLYFPEQMGYSTLISPTVPKLIYSFLWSVHRYQVFLQSESQADNRFHTYKSLCVQMTISSSRLRNAIGVGQIRCPAYPPYFETFKIYSGNQGLRIQCERTHCIRYP